MDDKILKKGTLRCPNCKETLWFKQIHGMRLVENGLLEAKCPKEGKIYNHFEPKFHARYFNNLELDKKTIVILLENEGWLLNNQENNQFITWLGDIYNKEEQIFE